MAKQFRLASGKTGRIFLGVLSGIANYTSIDVAILRIAFVIAFLLGGIGLGIYLLLWLFAVLIAGYDD